MSPAFFFPLDLIVQLLYTFSKLLAKKDRAARAGGRSQGGNARGGQRQRSYRSSPLFQMIKSRALTILNFGHASDFAWMTRRRMRLPITSAEHFLLLGVQVSLALFQHECSHNPDRLPNKAISCHLRARHARIFPSGEPAPAGCVGSLSWRVPMCGRHQQLDATEHTFSFLETA